MKTRTASEMVARMVEEIWKDICDRQGFDLNCLEQRIQDEVKERWRAAIVKEMQDYYGIKP